MLDFSECRNAEASVLENEGILSLRDYLKSKFLQNAGMKEQILNRRLLEFGMEYIF